MNTKIFPFCLVLLAASLNLRGQTTSKNYIKTTEVFTPVTTESTLPGIPDESNARRTTIGYYDGMGRPVQTIVRAKSPKGNDIVQFMEYDPLGRQPKNFLPFVKTAGNGTFVDNASQLQAEFYSQTVTPELPTTANPYSETRFENSPLNRVLETASPGEPWAMGSGHTVTIKTQTNFSPGVWLWKEENGIISNGGVSYPTGKLYEKTVKDEDGNKTITFTTIEGKQVLVRRYFNNQNFDTYYVYDAFGQVVCVIMPNATVTAEAFNDWNNAYRYFYNSKRQLYEKWLPGIQPVYYVYDKADRLVFEQDGNNTDARRWKFYKYDGQGRVIMEGFYNRTITRSALQIEVNNSQNKLFEVKDNMDGDFDRYFGYTNLAMPDIAGDVKVETVYYYDSYDFDSDGNAETEYNKYWKATAGFSDAAVKWPQGQLTGRYFVDEGYEVMFYDRLNRVVQSCNMGFYTGNKYFFNGMLKTSNQSFVYNTTSEIFYTFDYTYDHNWRPTGTQLTLNGMTTQINTLQYNELSQLKAKYLNGTATSHVQRQLYYYNARGWLTRINDPNIYCNDVFAEKLYYNSVPNYATSIARGCYNGNISTTEWFTKNMVTTGYLNGYGYTYDGLNRLTAAIFFSLQNATGAMQQEPANTSNQDYGTITGIGSEKNITYDKNGNMLTLNRYGRRSDGVVMFDQLSFQYAGNQLTKVIDAITGLNSLGDFRNTTSPTAKNEYDANGNLVFDVDRNMQLGYNSDNLPVTIRHDAGLISNTYRADGMKTNKMVYDGKGRLTLNETYLGDMVLNFGVPARIIHPEGVVELNSSLQPTFYYHLKDHLGNVRAVVTPTAANAATISQTSEYYPFGMCYTKNPGSYVNKYKFGGKEEQEMPGQYLDFGARFYDRQLPHFSSPDPLAELTIGVTPYHYCLNNPVSKIDPTGMWTTGLERNDAMMDLEERMSKDEGKTPSDPNKPKNLPQVSNTINDLLNGIAKFFGLGLDHDDPANKDKIDQANQRVENATETIKEQTRFIVINGALFAITEGGSVLLIRGAGAVIQTIRLSVEEAGMITRIAEGVEAAEMPLKTTMHGAERIAGAAATRGGVLTIEGIELTKSLGTVITQADGAAIYLYEVSPGRFNAVVESSNGIITTMENWSQKSILRIAKKYGWKLE